MLAIRREHDLLPVLLHDVSRNGAVVVNDADGVLPRAEEVACWAHASKGQQGGPGMLVRVNVSSVHQDDILFPDHTT